jgi:hypothetical protein
LPGAVGLRFSTISGFRTGKAMFLYQRLGGDAVAQDPGRAMPDRGFLTSKRPPAPRIDVSGVRVIQATPFRFESQKRWRIQSAAVARGSTTR